MATPVVNCNNFVLLTRLEILNSNSDLQFFCELELELELD